MERGRQRNKVKTLLPQRALLCFAQVSRDQMVKTRVIK